MLFDLANTVTGVIERLSPAHGGEDQLCAAVGGVAPPGELAESLQIADQLVGGGQAEVGARGEVGEPDAV